MSFYFTSSLPKILGLALPFAGLAILIDGRARRLAYPSLTFVGLLSLLEHKEWRFFVYAIPTLNICAAAGIESCRFLYVPCFARRPQRLTNYAGTRGRHGGLHSRPSLRRISSSPRSRSTRP